MYTQGWNSLRWEGFAVLDARSRCKRVVWAGFHGDRSISPRSFDRCSALCTFAWFRTFETRRFCDYYARTFHHSCWKQPWCFFSFFFFFWLRTFHPLNSSFMIRPHVVMFSERFWWWTQFKRQMLLKNAFYSPEIVNGSLAFNCHPVSINHVIIYLITNS